MRRKKLFFFITFLFLLLSFIIFTIQFGPEYIVELIGVNNTYLIIFIIAVIGGVSAITSTSFYTLFFAFLLGGADPFYLSLLGGIGLTIGDSVFFYFGYKSRELVEKTKYISYIRKSSSWLKMHKKEFIFLVTYVYVAFTPFPKDILSSILGLSNFSFKSSIIAFLLGNITHCMSLGLLFFYNFI